MKYNAFCPSCSHEFEVSDETHARAGLKCPECSIGFVPETIYPVEPTAEERTQEQEDAFRAESQKEYEALISNADWCFWIGLLLLFSTIICLLAGVANQSVACFAGAGAALSFALGAFLFSHLLHIRAALQKLYLKE